MILQLNVYGSIITSLSISSFFIDSTTSVFKFGVSKVVPLFSKFVDELTPPASIWSIGFLGASLSSPFNQASKVFPGSPVKQGSYNSEKKPSFFSYIDKLTLLGTMKETYSIELLVNLAILAISLLL